MRPKDITAGIFEIAMLTMTLLLFIIFAVAAIGFGRLRPGDTIVVPAVETKLRSRP